MSIDQPATPCFISYRHSDEDDLVSVVTQFETSLSAFYQAITGRSLAIFRDRNSIGWGEDWRDRIRDSVANATVFIPVLTMRYFESEICSEELMAFYSNAQQLGVTELLLPVVVLGAANITAEDPREEVRLIERLQYVNIEEAWLAGYESGAWRTRMHEIATRLDRALRSAEASLAESPISSGVATAVSAAGIDDSASADLTALNHEAERFGPLVESTLDALNRFFEIAMERMGDGVAWDTLSPGQANARLLGTATEIKPASEELELRANELLAFTSEFDAGLRSMIAELQGIGDETASALLVQLLAPMSELDDLSETLGQMDSVSSVLKTLSLLSVHLRKAIRPGINAIQAVRTAMATANSWSSLAEGSA